MHDLEGVVKCEVCQSLAILVQEHMDTFFLIMDRQAMVLAVPVTDLLDDLVGPYFAHDPVLLSGLLVPHSHAYRAFLVLPLIVDRLAIEQAELALDPGVSFNEQFEHVASGLVPCLQMRFAGFLRLGYEHVRGFTGDDRVLVFHLDKLLPEGAGHVLVDVRIGDVETQDL